MVKAMLGNLPLSAVRGPRDSLEEKLAGDNGEEWLIALKRFLRKENPWGNDSAIPGLLSAPVDTYRGANIDGCPYEFLLKHYGVWLQEGSKYLDRPILARLDKKLLKALQQKSTRNQDSMPLLNEIFPTKTEAALNRMRDGVAG
jgi:hypothetical protein